MNQADFWTYIYERTNRFYNLIFVISSAVLTFALTLNYSVIIEYDYYNAADYQVNLGYAFGAMMIMLPIYWYMAYKKSFVNKTLQTISTGKGWGAFVYSILVMYQLLQDAQANFEHIILELQRVWPTFASWEGCGSLVYSAVLPGICALSFVGIFVFVLKGADLFCDFVHEIVANADKNEKRYFCIAMLVCVSLICFFYSRTHMQWTTLDIIYQTDSSFIYEHYYPVFSNGFEFDWDIGNGGIRHPLTTLFTYPVYVVTSFMANLLFFVPNCQAVMYAVIQSVMLIVTVILLKRMIKSEWIYLIFTLSFPFLFFTIFVEKYQLATFFVVAYCYYIVVHPGKKKEVAELGMVGAAGTMITSAWLAFFWGEQKKIKGRIKEYAGLFLRFLAILIGSGRINYLWNFGYLINHNFRMFTGKELFSKVVQAVPALSACTAFLPEQIAVAMSMPIYDRNLELIPVVVRRVCAFFNLLVSCLIPIPYTITESLWGENVFYWRSVTGELNILGIVIFVLLIAIFIKHRKERNVQVFSMWVLWAFLQFAVIGFSAGCSPLFSLYFAWAVIPLLLIGMKDVLKTPLQQMCGYGALSMIMLYTNYKHLYDLCAYMMVEGPVTF